MDGGSPATVEIPNASSHIINVWMREAGFRIDKILLTTDAAFTPAASRTDRKRERHTAFLRGVGNC